MRRASRFTSALLGVYAGLLGAVHGYFEVRQGNVVPESLMINAIGPPCQADAVAHACFPAMTLIPNFLATGLLAIALGLATAIWAAGFAQRRGGGLVLILLAVAMLLVGGGFVPMFVGLMAAVAVIGGRRKASSPGNFARRLGAMWPWLLAGYFLWVLGGQWLLGALFPDFLLRAGLALFFLFDFVLPWMAVFAALARDAVAADGTQSRAES